MGKQTNKRKHPAIKQGVQIVLSKYTIAAFSYQVTPHSSLTLTLTMEDFQAPRYFVFFSVFLEHLPIYMTHIPIPQNILKSL